MSKKYENSSDKEDNQIFTFIIVFLVLMIIAIAVFEKHQSFLLVIWKTIYLPQAEVISWLSSTSVGNLLNNLLGIPSEKALTLYTYLYHTPAKVLNYHFCKLATSFINHYVFVIYLVLSMLLVKHVYTMTQSNSPVFKNFKNADSFLNYVNNNVSKKFKLLDFNKEEIKAGGYASSALSPFEFARQHTIIDLDKITHEVISFHHKKASYIFVKQLGDVYKDINALLNKPYGDVARTFMDIIPDEYSISAIEYATQGHRYDYTVLISLYIVASRFATIPLLRFTFLRKTHRTLWYGLLNVGRKTAFVEGAAITAQFKHEIQSKISNSKSRTKQIEMAVAGLKEAVFDETYLESNSSNDIWAHYFENDI